MYGLCVWFVPERGKMPHAPPKEVPNGRFLGTFSPMNARGEVNSTSMKMKLTVSTTNIA